MSIKGVIALGAALGVAAAAAPAAAQGAACNAKSPAELEREFDKFNAAWATKDPDKVAKLFTKSAVLLPTVSNQARTTPDGVRDYFVSFLKGSPQARIDSSTIKLDCNSASRLGTWTVTLTDAATGQKRDVKARYSFIYRYEDGGWKIDHLHSSMMPEPAA